MFKRDSPAVLSGRQSAILQPSSFYSIFVDLLIMHQRRYVSYGAGGFVFSLNASCGMLK